MKLNLAKNKWQTNSLDHSELIAELKKAGLDYSSAFLNVCINRGFKNPEDIKEAVNETPQLFHDPYLLYDMDRAVDRIEEAIALGEKIVIYGDYDADGITATLILLEGLESVGANVDYYLPNRHIDGYGPNLDRYKKLIADGAEVILTCDNGVTGFEAVDYANSQGVDVIITDHHTIQDELPNAYAVIHPAHPKGNYPFDDLAGAGVALKLITALLQEIPSESLELAAIGTICDLVSLTDENRTIVKSGLKLMQETGRIGLDLLLKSQSVKPTDINEETVGFIIGPRLNSVGRLGDPTPGLELLRTFEPSEAKDKLDIVNGANDERRALVDQINDELNERLDSKDKIPNIIIEAGSNWSAGVLGIVASRVVEKYQRPCILFEHQVDKGIYKGSGRSTEGVNLFEWLSNNKETMEQFGGHSQAAGVTIKEDKWDEFLTAMEQTAFENQDQVELAPTLDVDLKLELDEINVELINEINLLAPFGTDNPEVTVMLEDVELSSIKKVGRDESHIKLSVTDESQKKLDGIAFSQADDFKGLKEGTKISLVGKLTINEWNGQVNPQINISDRGIKGPLWLDCRGSSIPDPLIELTDSLYLYENLTHARQFESRLSSNSQINLYRNEIPDLSQFKYLVIMEPAKDISILNEYINNDWERIYLGAYTRESYYMSGPPKREECALVYRYINQHKNFRIRDRLINMMNELNLPLIKINSIIMMFLEADFIDIDEGVLTLKENESQEKVNLLETKSYQAYLNALESEKILTLTPITQLSEYFEG